MLLSQLKRAGIDAGDADISSGCKMLRIILVDCMEQIDIQPTIVLQRWLHTEQPEEK